MDFLLLLPLLSVCLLSCSGTTSGETVVKVEEGSEAVLPCLIRPERNIRPDVFEWKKDGQNVFFYENGKHHNNGLTGQDEQFKGRVSHFPEQLQSGNASIVIRNTTVTDSGTYSCDYSPDEPNRQTFYIKLVVGQTVIRVNVGIEAVLPCLIRPERDITRDVFDWKKDGQEDVFFHEVNGRTTQGDDFTGRVFNFPDQLQSGVASIVIRNTKLSDSGTYTCVFSPGQSNSQMFYIELVVVCILRDRSGENISGACKKPSVRTLNQTSDWAILQCEVQGVSPKTKVEWQNSSGNILTAEKTPGPKTGDIILKTTVTKTDNYQCVVTQEDICHQVSGETFVFIPGQTVVRVTEGSEAVLPCLIGPVRDITGDVFEWKKDGQNVFFYENSKHHNNGLTGQDEQFKGRVSHFPEKLQFSNASIVIRDTKPSDSGTYTCDFSPDEPNRQTFTIDLVVGACKKPYVTMLNQSSDWAILQCAVQGVSPKTKVEWKDSSGNNLTAEKTPGPKTGDIILKTTVTKTDNYQCVVTQEDICHQVSEEIFVFIHGPEPPKVVCPMPVIRLLDQTRDKAQLQCKVGGVSPKPKVKWQDRTGNILPAEETRVPKTGGNYDIILKTTVTKTDNYSCVVTQEGVCPQVSAETFVLVHAPCPKPHIRLLDQTRDKAQLQCEVGGVSPKPEVKWQDSSGNVLPAEETPGPKTGGNYDIILKTTVTKTGNYRCVVTQEGVCPPVSAETPVYIHGPETYEGPDPPKGPEATKGPSTGLVAVVVVQSIILLGVSLAVLYYKRHRIQRLMKGSQTETKRDEEKNSSELDELNKSPSSSDNKNSVATKMETDEEEKL